MLGFTFIRIRIPQAINEEEGNGNIRGLKSFLGRVDDTLGLFLAHGIPPLRTRELALATHKAATGIVGYKAFLSL